MGKSSDIVHPNKTSTVENEETEDNSKGIDSTLMLLCPLIPTTSLCNIPLSLLWKRIHWKMIQNMQTKLNKLWMNLLNIIVGTTVFSPQERRPYVGYYQGQHYQSLEQKQTGLKRKISFANEVNSKKSKKNRKDQSSSKINKIMLNLVSILLNILKRIPKSRANLYCCVINVTMKLLTEATWKNILIVSINYIFCQYLINF